MRCAIASFPFATRLAARRLTLVGSVCILRNNFFPDPATLLRTDVCSLSSSLTCVGLWRRLRTPSCLFFFPEFFHSHTTSLTLASSFLGPVNYLDQYLSPPISLYFNFCINSFFTFWFYFIDFNIRRYPLSQKMTRNMSLLKGHLPSCPHFGSPFQRAVSFSAWMKSFLALIETCKNFQSVQNSFPPKGPFPLPSLDSLFC